MKLSRMDRPVFFLLMAAAWLMADFAAHAQEWLDKDWACRRRIALPGNPLKARDGYVLFSTCGLASPDGRDVVVTAGPRRPVASKVISCGYDDSVLVAFELDHGSRNYHVYFGNPRAEKTLDTWEPRGGVLVEVRARGAGTANTLGQMFDLMARSPRVLGRTFCERPQFSANPFGPQKDFILIFSGQLQLPELGEYTFALNSRDASFVIIDGQALAEWPGLHDEDPFAAEAHSGRILLKGGLHTFRVYNAAFNHGGCALGIRLPSWQEIAPVPRHLVPPIIEGKALGLERADRKPAVDFMWRMEADLGLEGLDITRMTFKNMSAMNGQAIQTCVWNFGDGQTRRGQEVEHIFLESGIYPVKMTLTSDRGEGWTLTQRVRVHPWASLMREGNPWSDAYLWEFLTLCRDYDFAAASPGACLSFAHMAGYGGKPDLEFRALEEVFRKNPSLADEEMVEDALIYGTRLVGEASRFEEAAALYLRVAQEATAHKQIMEARLSAGEVYLFYLGDREAAEGLFLSMQNQAGPHYNRRLKLRLIDAALAGGLIQEAKARYLKLGEAPYGANRLNDIALTHGHYKTTFQAYMAQGNPSFAEEILRQWELVQPALKAGGELTYSWALLMMAREQWQAAARQLKWTLDLAPESNRAPGALLRLAQCHAMLGDEKAARACYDRICKEHPFSPERGEAEKKR